MNPRCSGDLFDRSVAERVAGSKPRHELQRLAWVLGMAGRALGPKAEESWLIDGKEPASNPDNTRIFFLKGRFQLRITIGLECRPVQSRFEPFAVRRAQ